MNTHPSPLFTISFRMERGDFVALSMAIARRDPGRTLGLIALYLASLLAVALLGAGSPERLLLSLERALSRPAALLYLSLILAGPALLLAAPSIAALSAAALYRRNAIADRDVTLELTVDGIEGGSTDLYSRIGWAAVQELIETPTHLFIRISRREALLIPRRAVPNEDNYANLVGFIRARTGLSSR